MAIWQSYSRRAFIRVRQAIAIVNANLQENVSGVRVIQSLSREDENAKRFDSINQQNLRANVDAGRLTAAVTPAVEVIVAIAMSLVIGYGGWPVLHGQMEVAALIAFTLQLQLFFDPVRDLVLQYTQLQRAMAGGERVIEVLDTKPEFEDAPDAVDLPDDIAGARRLQPRDVPLRRRRAGARRHRPARQAGRDDRARRVRPAPARRR